MKSSMCKVTVKTLVITTSPGWDAKNKDLIIIGLTADKFRTPHYVWASWTLPIADFHTLSVLPYARVGSFLELSSASCSFSQEDNPEVVSIHLDEPEFSEVDPMSLDVVMLDALHKFLDEQVEDDEVADCLRDCSGVSREELLQEIAETLTAKRAQVVEGKGTSSPNSLPKYPKN